MPAGIEEVVLLRLLYDMRSFSWLFLYINGILANAYVSLGGEGKRCGGVDDRVMHGAEFIDGCTRAGLARAMV